MFLVIWKCPDFYSLLQQTVTLGYFWYGNYKLSHQPSRIFRQADRFKTPPYFTRYGKRTRADYVSDIFYCLPDLVSPLDSTTNVKNSLIDVGLSVVFNIFFCFCMCSLFALNLGLSEFL